MYLNIIKTIYDRPTGNTTLNDKKLKAFSLRSRRRERCPLLQLLFSIVLEVPSRAIKQEKVKVIQIRKKEVSVCRRQDFIYEKP